MKFHKVTEQEFSEWLLSDPNEDELREAFIALEKKKADLWDNSSHDSFSRDRYDRDSIYMTRLRRVKAALSAKWVETGQVTPVVYPWRG